MIPRGPKPRLESQGRKRRNTPALWILAAAPLAFPSAWAAGSVAQPEPFPRWLTLSLFALAGLLLLLAALTIAMRQRIRVQTAELTAKNQKLEQEIAERERAQVALREGEHRLRTQNEALVELARIDASQRGDLKAALRRITEVATRTLNVERASVWAVDLAFTRILCLDLYEREKNTHSDGAELLAANYPSYFAALREDRVIAAHAAHVDERTREFSEAYLTPLGISSMLDAPIRVGARMVGVVCHEHVGPPRAWLWDEQNFASALADSVALAMESIERVRAEIEVQRNAQYFRALIENALDIIEVIDRNMLVLYASPSVMRAFGYSPDEIIGRHCFEFVHPDDIDALAAATKFGILNPGVTYPTDCRVRHRDGSWRYTESLARNLDHDPVVSGTIVNVRDITERRVWEQAVRETNERNSIVLDNAMDAVVSMDGDGLITGWNAQAEAIFGWPRDEAIGRDLSSTIVPEQHRAAHERGFRRYISTGKQNLMNQRVEMTAMHRDGREFPVELSVTATCIATKYYFSAFLRDITGRRKARELLENYSRTLEQEVAQRTHEVNEKNVELESTLRQLKDTQRQLIHNEKMASLGALTAGIAHEIKNPLNFIVNFSDLANELLAELRQKLATPAEDPAGIQTLLDDVSNNVTRILEHGKRADSIVRGMLLHSRGKAGERQSTDLNALLDEYVKLAYHGMRAQEPAFSASMKTAYDESIPPIDAAPQDLSRAFLNILNNACYSVHEKKLAATGPYSPEIQIRTADLGDSVQISIRDNGAGMSPEVREKVFTPFFTTKPAGKGTGLGLAICYNIIVEEHHGAIGIDTEEGQYAQFTIVLPKRGNGHQDEAKPRTEATKGLNT